MTKPTRPRPRSLWHYKTFNEVYVLWCRRGIVRYRFVASCEEKEMPLKDWHRSMVPMVI